MTNVTKEFRKIHPDKEASNAPTGKLFAPTKQEKLVYIAEKLGRKVSEMQGTSRNIFDTVIIPISAAGRQTVTLFDQTTNKSKNFSNFQNGQLLAGESLLLEKINVELLQLTNANLSDDTNVVLETMSLPMNLSSVNIAAGTMTINISNSNVVIDYSMNELLPWNQPYSTGLVFVPGPNSIIAGLSEISMEAPPVLTEAQRIRIDLNIPPYPTMGGAGTFWALKVTLGRFGSIFSPKTNL